MGPNSPSQTLLSRPPCAHETALHIGAPVPEKRCRDHLRSHRVSLANCDLDDDDDDDHDDDGDSTITIYKKRPDLL